MLLEKIRRYFTDQKLDEPEIELWEKYQGTGVNDSDFCESEDHFYWQYENACRLAEDFIKATNVASREVVLEEIRKCAKFEREELERLMKEYIEENPEATPEQLHKEIYATSTEALLKFAEEVVKEMRKDG